MTYENELLEIVRRFEFVLCEKCDGDVHEHVYAADQFGKPQAFCLRPPRTTVRQDSQEPEDDTYREALIKLIEEFDERCPHCGLGLRDHTIAIGHADGGELYPDPWCPEECGHDRARADDPECPDCGGELDPEDEED